MLLQLSVAKASLIRAFSLPSFILTALLWLQTQLIDVHTWITLPKTLHPQAVRNWLCPLDTHSSSLFPLSTRLSIFITINPCS